MASPTADMGLAFRTRQKLAGTRAPEDRDLRRVVLLCNTYDSFQRRLAEHFCASRTLYAGDKAHVVCRELGVLDDDDDDSSDDEDDDDDDDEHPPPPYEMYLSADATATRDFSAEPRVTALEVDDDDDDEEYGVDPVTQTPEHAAHRSPTSYSTPTTHTAIATKEGPLPVLHHVGAAAPEPKPVSATPPPLPPRSIRRLGPGLSARIGYGHHTVGLSSEHAHGVMEVH